MITEDLRAVFFTAFPDTDDLDLRAAHQQCIGRRHPELEAVVEYGRNSHDVRPKFAEGMDVTVRASISEAVAGPGGGGDPGAQRCPSCIIGLFVFEGTAELR